MLLNSSRIAMRTISLFALTVASLIFFSGCSQYVQKRGEETARIAGQRIQNNVPKNIDLNLGQSGEFSLSTSDGTTTFGKDSVPDTWPKDIPV